MARRIIYISGIGADSRAFSHLRIKGSYEHVYTDWISANRDETFVSYCKRFRNQYHIESNDILLGLSFGGLIAQQIGHFLHSQKVVMISSFRSRNDLQGFWNFCLRFNLHLTFPPFRIPLIADIITISLNAQNKEGSKLLRDMQKDADFRFIKWALQKIRDTDLTTAFKDSYLVMNGNKDLLVKDWKSTGSITIDQGSHFMVHNHASRLASLIEEYLAIRANQTGS